MDILASLGLGYLAAALGSSCATLAVLAWHDRAQQRRRQRRTEKALASLRAHQDAAAATRRAAAKPAAANADPLDSVVTSFRKGS
jgi:hypothetical protein